MTTLTRIRRHQTALRKCTRCPDMVGPVITGTAMDTSILLLGQAPGPREGDLGRPFAWTAGKTLFKWFSRIGLDETQFRARVYMAAVCRCFPGKNPGGGDRVPNREEIDQCSRWLDRELDILEPGLILPVGKLAIAQFMDVKKLDQVIGGKYRIIVRDRQTDIIPLPHPSGASTWHRTEPGKTLLEKALKTIGRHPAWKAACRT